MSKISYCYHSHTKRCGHAIGNDEEYVLAAIKLGIKRLGFSDHVFLKGVNQPWMRGKFEMLDDYLSSINYLKDKYKDKIEILAGFEAEYLPTHLETYKELLETKKIDYLILGQHTGEENDGLVPYFYPSFSLKGLYRYGHDVVKGIESGLFTYLCHPDLFMNAYKKWDSNTIKVSKMILEACEKYHVPIEINIGGMRHGNYNPIDHYPSDQFFQLSKKYKVEIVVGVDAHNPIDYNEEDIAKVLEFIKRNKLKVNLDYVIKKD